MTSKTSSSLVPDLRFPEFNGAPEWRCCSMGQYLSESRVKGSTGEQAHKLTVKLWGKGVVEKQEAMQGSANTQYYRRRAGQFIYSKLDFLNQAFGIIPAHLDGFESTVDLPCFDIDSELNAKFLLEYVQREGFYKVCGEVADGGRKAKRIQVETFLGFPIFVPSKDEQEKIADCLESLDDLIAAEGRKLERLRQHKQGLMQQLFPQGDESVPRRRFPEFMNEGKWKRSKLDGLAKRGSGHTPKRSRSAYYNGGIKWVSLADSKRLDKGLISETAVELSDQGIKNSSAVLHPAGSVVLSRDAGVGKSAVISCPMAVSQHFIVWTCDPTTLSNWFLYHQLQLLKPVFEQIATGSTIKTIGLPFFKELQIALPTVNEQNRVADCLSSLDARLAAHEKKIELLKAHKKGLLQQLFLDLEEQSQ